MQNKKEGRGRQKRLSSSQNDMLEGLKETRQKYQPTKIKQEIYDRFAIIAEDRNITFPGRIINHALEQWLEMYDQEKES